METLFDHRDTLAKSGLSFSREIWTLFVTYSCVMSRRDQSSARSKALWNETLKAVPTFALCPGG